MSRRNKGKSQRSLSRPSAPPEDKKLARHVMELNQYSGPLPPPSALERYSEIIPNGAERIMVMAEEQSKHRRELEKMSLRTDSRNSLLGIIAAFLLGTITIVTGGVVAIYGYSLGGAILGSSGLVGLVSAFIFGTRERRKEREAKAKIH
jgi:uncharacterized membrane protein